MVVAFLMVVSASWLAVLTLGPGLRQEPLFLVGTVAALAVNGVAWFAVLIRLKRIPLLLNLLQILLFAMAHAQIAAAYGLDNYRSAREPDLFDWQLFAWSHALYAADLAHVLESYGWNVNPIQPAGAWPGILLVVMHWNVSLFVVGLLVRWCRRVWQRLVHGAVPDRARAARWKVLLKRWQRGGLVVALAAVALTALSQRWQLGDWLRWPLDNVIRTIDLGQTMSVFGWRLHGVATSVWIATLGIGFRLLAGSYVARWLHALHVRWLGARALRPLDDYIQDLADDDNAVRIAAAQSLGEIGAAAGPAMPALIAAVSDDIGPVATATRQALASIHMTGPSAAAPVPELVHLLQHADWAIRRAAATALGGLGLAGAAALPALVACLADRDRSLERIAERSLTAIDPAWPENALALAAVPLLIRTLEERQGGLRQRAAETLGRLGRTAGAAAPELIARLKDRDEYVRLSAQWALDRIEPQWRATLLRPAFLRLE